MKLSRREWFASLLAVVVGKFYKPKPISEPLGNLPVIPLYTSKWADPGRIDFIDFVCYDPGCGAMIYNLQIPDIADAPSMTITKIDYKNRSVYLNTNV